MGGEATGVVGRDGAVGLGLAMRPAAARGSWVEQGRGRLAVLARGGVRALASVWFQRLVGDLLRAGRCSAEGLKLLGRGGAGGRVWALAVRIL